MSHDHGEARMIEKVHKSVQNLTETAMGWFSHFFSVKKAILRKFPDLFLYFWRILNTIVGGRGWKEEEEEEEDNLMESVLFFRIGQFPRECSVTFTVNSGYGQVATASIPVARPKHICCKKYHERKLSLQITQICRDGMLGVYNIWTKVHAASVWKSTP